MEKNKKCRSMSNRFRQWKQSNRVNVATWKIVNSSKFRNSRIQMKIVQGNSAMQPRFALVQNVKASQAAFRRSLFSTIRQDSWILVWSWGFIGVKWIKIRVGNKIRPRSPFRTELGVSILPDKWDRTFCDFIGMTLLKNSRLSNHLIRTQVFEKFSGSNKCKWLQGCERKRTVCLLLLPFFKYNLHPKMMIR